MKKLEFFCGRTRAFYSWFFSEQCDCEQQDKKFYQQETLESFTFDLLTFDSAASTSRL